ncbi:MAG: hypothetical protein RL660_2946 [Bacteroidota bacterium]|jgi:hypothetical protein
MNIFANTTAILITLCFATLASCQNSAKPSAPTTIFRLTKDSTSIGLWGHKARLAASGPSDIFRGFGFYLMHIYSKNDSIYVSTFDGTYYDTTLTWEEFGRWEAERNENYDPSFGPAFGYFEPTKWQFFDSVTLVDYTPDSEIFDDYLEIQKDNSLTLTRKYTKKFDKGDLVKPDVTWTVFTPKHDSIKTNR